MKKIILTVFITLFLTACEMEPSADGQVMDPSGDIQMTTYTSSSDETIVASSLPVPTETIWTREKIDEVFEKGNISDVFQFTMGDGKETVEHEIGVPDVVQNEPFGIRYDDMVVFYNMYDPDATAQVIGVTLEGEHTYFGLRLGVSNTKEVTELLKQSLYEGYGKYGEFSQSEPEEGTESFLPDERYYNCLYRVGEYSIHFYFTDDVLSTIYIYNPDR